MKPTAEQLRDALTLVLNNCPTHGHGDSALDEAAEMLHDALDELETLLPLRKASERQPRYDITRYEVIPWMHGYCVIDVIARIRYDSIYYAQSEAKTMAAHINKNGIKGSSLEFTRTYPL